MEAVAAADGADLAGAGHPGQGRADDVADDLGVVVGLAEEGRAPAVAGEQQARPSARAGVTPAISDRSSSSALSASRTWNWTVVPTSTWAPMATPRRSGSTPVTLRMRKSPV